MNPITRATTDTEVLYLWLQGKSKTTVISYQCHVKQFLEFTDKPLERTYIHKMIKKCCQKAGVSEKASSHWLRHSHASHAIDKGCNLRLLQESLGHSKLETTEKYLHINPDEGSSQFSDI
jgi:integrase/recombinase XerD